MDILGRIARKLLLVLLAVVLAAPVLPVIGASQSVSEQAAAFAPQLVWADDAVGGDTEGDDPEGDGDGAPEPPEPPLPEPPQPPAPDKGVVDNSGKLANHIVAADVSKTTHFTVRPPKVTALKKLKIYSNATFDAAYDTGKVVKKNATVQAKSLVWTKTGYPRIKVSGGYILAERSAVKLPALSTAKSAKAVIAIDAATGKVLYQRNAKKGYSPASISKLMTALLVREKVAKVGYSWGSKVTIKSKRIQKLSMDRKYGCGGYNLKVGKTYTVKELYKLTLVESNNAAAIQLGIWVAGSNNRFVKQMNARAKALELNATKFVSASGLENKWLAKFKLTAAGTSKKAYNKMSAADVARLARFFVSKYPDVLSVTKLTKFKLRGKTVKSTNSLLPGNSLNKTAAVRAYNYDGLKTGTTGQAGPCLSVTAAPTGRTRVIVVVLNDRNRFTNARSMVASLYAHFDLGYNG